MLDQRCLTFDLDWAPEFVLEEFYSILQTISFPVTVFATHSSPTVSKILELKQVETAIHPNFYQSKDEAQTLQDLLKVFPKAKGVRNHRLYYFSGILEHYHRERMDYFSNDLLFLQKGIEPFYDWSGMVRLPIFWEDDVHAIYFDSQYDLKKLSIEAKGLQVFNFHPIHLYLNTQKLEDYMAAKPDLKDSKSAKKHQKSEKGTRTLFEEIVKSHFSSSSKSMLQVAQEFKKANLYSGKYKDYQQKLRKGLTL